MTRDKALTLKKRSSTANISNRRTAEYGGGGQNVEIEQPSVAAMAVGTEADTTSAIRY